MKLHFYVFVLVAGLVMSCGKKSYPTATANSTAVKSNDALVASEPFRTANYNNTFYPSVLEAAKGVAQPFLLQQGYLKIPGVTVNDTNLIYEGESYHVFQQYWNPAKDPAKAYHKYTIKEAEYSKYNAGNLLDVWPKSCPNALYDTATKTFNATIDCVGYGSRLLGAVGDGTSGNNAYVELINQVKAVNTAVISAKGHVSTAYSFATVFPSLRTKEGKGWTYIAGSVDAPAVDEYNHTKSNKLGKYDGVRKGGFANSIAGDVLCFGNGPGTKFNGHFMVIASKPRLLDADGLRYYYPNVVDGIIRDTLQAYRIYAVPVFDDSGLEAHFDDSRHRASGIGHGTVLVVTSPTDDAPIGIITKASKKENKITIRMVSENKSTSMYALSVARYK